MNSSPSTSQRKSAFVRDILLRLPHPIVIRERALLEAFELRSKREPDQTERRSIRKTARLQLRRERAARGQL